MKAVGFHGIGDNSYIPIVAAVPSLAGFEGELAALLCRVDIGSAGCGHFQHKDAITLPSKDWKHIVHASYAKPA